MEIVLAFVIFMVIVIAMSIGVLLGRNPIKGSCGGVGAAMGEKDYVCDICGGDPDKCESQGQTADNSDLAYDAAKPRDARIL